MVKPRPAFGRWRGPRTMNLLQAVGAFARLVWRVWRHPVVQFATLGLVAGACLLGGTVLGLKEAFPSTLIRDLNHLFNPAAQDVNLQTAFFPIRQRSQKIPLGRDGAGGGLTSFGPDVLVLTHDGRIFAADGKSPPRQLAITPPDNHFAEYAALAGTPAAAGLHIDPVVLRYNDLLYYQAPAERGLVISYTDYNPARRCYTTTLARYVIGSGTQGAGDLKIARKDWKPLFTTAPCLPLNKEFAAIEGQIAGGRMAFRPPGKIILTSGDYEQDGIYHAPAVAQDMSKQYGKVLEIDLASGAARILTSGHRNMQGVLIDDSGRLWTVEHGMKGGDELNLEVEGQDYGWPRESLGTLYSNLPLPNQDTYGRHDHFHRPVFDWTPSIAVSNLIQIKGFHPVWDGDLLVGSLRGAALHKLKLDGDHVISDETIPMGDTIRFVLQHTDGEIVVWNGYDKLTFLSPASLTYSNGVADEVVGAMKLSPAEARGLRANLASCTECHAFDADTNAPNLRNVIGRSIASTHYAGYSQGLKSVPGRWSEQKLDAFLVDPRGFAPGSHMPKPNFTDPQGRHEVVAFLKAYGERITYDGAPKR
jgi:cytochrome c2